MAPAKKAGQGAKALPPMTVARFEDTTRLVESLIGENVSVFSGNIAKYRAVRREGSQRPLDAVEVGQVGAALGIDMNAEDAPAKLAALQKSELRAVDEVSMNEALVPALTATAPAAIECARKLVALVEMGGAEYRKAREDGKLDEVIAEHAAVYGDIEMADARPRAAAAFAHFQAAAGASQGEAWSLILKIVGQAMGQAIEAAPGLGSAFASLTGSPEPTDGAE